MTIAILTAIAALAILSRTTAHIIRSEYTLRAEHNHITPQSQLEQDVARACFCSVARVRRVLSAR